MLERAQYLVGVKVRLGKGTCRFGVTGVITVQRLDPGQHVRCCCKGQQARAGRQIAAETGFLREHGPTRGQVTDATVAKPTTARRHIAAFGNAKFCLGALNKAAVMCWRLCHLRRVQQTPAIGLQRRQIGCLSRMDGERQQKLLIRQRGQRHERTQRMGFLAVNNTFMTNRSVTAPVRNGRQCIIVDVRRHRPLCQDHRRAGRYPVQAAGGLAAIRLAQVQAHGHKMGMAGKALIKPRYLIPKPV